MKINWGTGIAIFYISFMAAMLFMVYRSTFQNRDLVVDNYYQKDLEYQSHLNRVSNAKKLDVDLKITKEDGPFVSFSFPKEVKNIEGKILFYRSSDKGQDVRIGIKVDENNNFVFPTAKLKKGGWRVKVDWEGDNIPFYKEVNISI